MMSRRSALLATLALTIAGGPLVSCTDGRKQPPTPPTQLPDEQVQGQRVKPTARLVLLPDLQGYLEPCGCQKRPLGGIDRAASEVARLRGEAVPTAVVAAGSLLFEAAKPGHADDESGRDQEVWKAETLVAVLNDMPLSAAVPGPQDARFGAATTKAILKQAEFPTLGTFVDGPRHRVLDLGGLKLGLLALGRGGASDATTLVAEAKEAVQHARADGATVTVAVVQAPARLARRLAGGVAGLDFVLLTGRDTDSAAPPSQRGETTVLSGSRHGRGLLVLDLVHKRPGPYRDASDWTRRERRAAAQRQADELRKRIADWKKDPQVDAAQLATQERRLAELERAASSATSSHATPSPGTSVAAGNSFSASFIELAPEVARAPKTRARLAAYDKRVNTHNRTAFADWKPAPVPEGQAAYVGSERCSTCHAPAYAWWQKHAHGRAYDTLVERSKEYNLSCVGCHVTGYLKPGGSTVTHNEGLTHVGCESCHGPGSLHDGDKAGIVRAPSESLCVECHNEEHSDQFEFDSYRARLMAPGHGLPL